MIPQRGFVLVMAIFILVVLSLLGSYMVRLSGTQHATTNLSLQGVRAYQAAKAGLDWSIASLHAGGGCANVNAQTALAFPGMDGFTVALACIGSTYSEGDATVNFYRINAQSEYGTYDSVDYVSRRLEVSINLKP